MEFSYHSYYLQFLHPFGVSSNTRTTTTSIFVKLTGNGFVGYGEACLPAYLDDTEIGTIGFLEKCREYLGAARSDQPLSEITAEIDAFSESYNAAKAAIDIALHDLSAKQAEQPLHKYLGIPRTPPVATSFTIAIDSADKLERKLVEADNYAILKIKAGTADDKRLFRQIRKLTYKPLYVDVNQGWKDKHMVLDMIGWMKEQGVLLVEQPMPVSMRDEMAWVTEKSPLPTIADESVKRLKDLQYMKGVFSGVNLKLMKSGGIGEAMRMITEAKKQNLKIMLGCMAESSCGTAAMSHLMALADFVDLDAPRLYRNDPFTGLSYHNGKLQSPAVPGIGVQPLNGLFA